MNSPLPILQLQGSKSTPIPQKKKMREPPPLPISIRQTSFHHQRVESQPLSSMILPGTPRKSGGVPRLNVLREPRLHQTFVYKSSPQARLKSHRVGFAEYGPEHGHPVFVIGGYGCTRLVGIMFEEIAFRFNIRMIWPERPG